MKPKKIVVKKYGNRRLYDTTHSRYINQDEVAQMVRDGNDVQVLDAATGEDLTRLILTQIVVESAKEPGSAFPLDILRQMVVACGKATQENTLQYTKAVLDMYQNAYRAMAPQVNPFEFLQPLAQRQAAPAAWGKEVEAEADPRPAVKKEAVENDELKRRIEELEAMVSELGAKKGAGKRKTKARKRRS